MALQYWNMILVASLPLCRGIEMNMNSMKSLVWSTLVFSLKQSRKSAVLMLDPYYNHQQYLDTSCFLHLTPGLLITAVPIPSVPYRLPDEQSFLYLPTTYIPIYLQKLSAGSKKKQYQTDLAGIKAAWCGHRVSKVSNLCASALISFLLPIPVKH